MLAREWPHVTLERAGIPMARSAHDAEFQVAGRPGERGPYTAVTSLHKGLPGSAARDAIRAVVSRSRALAHLCLFLLASQRHSARGTKHQAPRVARGTKHAARRAASAALRPLST